MTVYVVSAFDYTNSNSAGAKRIKEISSIFNGQIVHMPYSGSKGIPSMFKYFRRLSEFALRNRNSIFYYYPTTNPFFEIIWCFFVVKYNVVVYYDLNEKRTVISRLNRFDIKSIKKFVSSTLKFPLFLLLEKAYSINSKLLVISHNLKERFKNKANCILIPPLVNIASAPYYPQEKTFNARLGYFGTITLYKEDFFTVFKALSILNLKGVKFYLDIYGSVARDQLEFSRLQQVFNIQDQVTIYPFIDNQETVLNAMRKVDILLLIRRDNVQNRYGFSTKLVEYLLSGTPVVATDVSDNALYIKHTQNGFLLRDYDSYELAELLLQIHSGNYDLFSIGAEGIKTALNFFDRNKYIELLNS